MTRERQTYAAALLLGGAAACLTWALITWAAMTGPPKAEWVFLDGPQNTWDSWIPCVTEPGWIGASTWCSFDESNTRYVPAPTARPGPDNPGPRVPAPGTTRSPAHPLRGSQ